jgi:type I restriction enzyme R subunit
MSHQSEATLENNQAIAGLRYASVKIQDGDALGSNPKSVEFLMKPLLLQRV